MAQKPPVCPKKGCNEYCTFSRLANQIGNEKCLQCSAILGMKDSAFWYHKHTFYIYYLCTNCGDPCTHNLRASKSTPNILSNTTTSPVSSNTSSPHGNNKTLSISLDKFSKEDLFKLFGKARKENRVLNRKNESLTAKNKDLFKALNASNEQNEVLQTNEKKSAMQQTRLLQQIDLLNKEKNILSTKMSYSQKNEAEFTEKLRKMEVENKQLTEQYNMVKTERDSLQTLTDQLLEIQNKSEIERKKLSQQINELTEKLKMSEIKNIKLMDEEKETKLELKEIKKELNKLHLDPSNYMNWSSDGVVDWIISVEQGKYAKYDNMLRAAFKKEQVDGAAMADIDRTELKLWGIASFKDRTAIYNKMQDVTHNNNKQQHHQPLNNDNNEGHKDITPFI